MCSEISLLDCLSVAERQGYSSSINTRSWDHWAAVSTDADKSEFKMLHCSLGEFS